MAKVINLRQARKQQTRETERRKADENAVRFGRNKAQKQSEETLAARAQRQLDGHYREND